MLKGNSRAFAALRSKGKKAKEAVKVEKRTPAEKAAGKADYKVTAPKKQGVGNTETLHKTSGAKKRKVVSGQTFGQAFAAARAAQGSGGKFPYKGKEYSTNTKDDKDKPFGKSSGLNAIVPGNLRKKPKKKIPKNYVER